ncbi:hypothetical protein HYFRA_00013690 [Hymenoscyphus fraxineus]|uniref:Uncharacterized protein n=1 Tax=Hymenoscyphus fraxineus TaxID=746836 RepID=A0A9N9LCV5_9HELO|nr:hypothetical protein HYFRA_00013690 [Hymenoscyphus fraxineus]
MALQKVAMSYHNAGSKNWTRNQIQTHRKSPRASKNTAKMCQQTKEVYLCKHPDLQLKIDFCKLVPESERTLHQRHLRCKDFTLNEEHHQRSCSTCLMRVTKGLGQYGAYRMPGGMVIELDNMEDINLRGGSSKDVAKEDKQKGWFVRFFSCCFGKRAR